MTFHAPRERAIADREQADRPASDHGDGVRGDVLASPGPERRVHRVAERLHDRGGVGMDTLPDDPGIHRRDHQVLGEGSLDVDAQDAQVLADVRSPGSTCRASPARDVGLRRHERSGLDVMHLGADSLDRPGHLVPERHRESTYPLLSPFVPVIDVEVGAADRGCVDANEHLALAGRRDGHAHQLGPGSGSRLAEGAHRPGHVREPIVKGGNLEVRDGRRSPTHTDQEEPRCG